jgi:hypothetical protein
MSQKNNSILKGTIDQLPSKKIIIEVKHLEVGNYELNIVNKDKLIKKTTFKKKQ